MARRLTLAERDDFGARAYDLSLEGHSARAIARQLGISHHTVTSLIQAESARRSAERPDRRQHALDSLRRAMRRAWQELDGNPSPHATAQLLHALNSLQSEMNKIDGVHAPTKVDARVSVQQESYVGNLADGPLEAVSIILEAASHGADGEDALAEVVHRYQAGTLAGNLYVSSADLLELVPPEEMHRVENLDELLKEKGE